MRAEVVDSATPAHGLIDPVRASPFFTILIEWSVGSQLSAPGLAESAVRAVVIHFPVVGTRSAVGLSLQVLRVAGALDRDLRRGAFKVAEIIRTELHIRGCDVLF